jgi:thiol:disulfide interchange protein DsbD
MMKPWVWGLMGLTALTAVAFAGDIAKEPEYVTFESASPTRLGPKSETSLVLVFKVAAGFHIQANPASNPQLIATTLQLPSANNFEVSPPVYPKGKSYKLEGSKGEISTYGGVVEIKVPVTTPGKVVPNKFPWKGKLRYQACNEKTCFFPKTLSFEVPLEIVAQ